ncbi:hypothetical protein ACMD2_21484 [Ananas comosus]|uniref:Uncharacterized protein n=1 Tax=Ananas comosus TaxID=4615 RepID=A0A199VI27_ANACO|nr:hypothetical protein ACMD2_21484 [Ananas comosus]
MRIYSIKKHIQTRKKIGSIPIRLNPIRFDPIQSDPIRVLSGRTRALPRSAGFLVPFTLLTRSQRIASPIRGVEGELCHGPSRQIGYRSNPHHQPKGEVTYPRLVSVIQPTGIPLATIIATSTTTAVFL